jgi:FkbM family methyltransferase
MVFSITDNKGVPLEEKLDSIFNQKTNGFFIELGANDGLTQSNTAFFEKYRNWTGILIEPSFLAFQKCLLNRTKSICINAACVSKDFNDNEIMGDFDSGCLMASINGERLNQKNLTKVKALTLENILDNNLSNRNIDFISLDTEGYEFNILNGLNLNKYRPQYMLIEIYKKDFSKILEFLKSHNYTLHSNFSNYNKIDTPVWDGTHNDYLFYDNLIVSKH